MNLLMAVLLFLGEVASADYYYPSGVEQRKGSVLQNQSRTLEVYTSTIPSNGVATFYLTKDDSAGGAAQFSRVDTIQATPSGAVSLSEDLKTVQISTAAAKVYIFVKGLGQE